MPAANNSFYLSVQAENDIETLFENTFDRIGLGSAEGVVLNLSIAFRRLAENSASAEDCSHIAEGLRSHVVDSQIVYFRHEDDGVNILRVLDRSLHQPQRVSH